jgi:hypothetical protein
VSFAFPVGAMELCTILLISMMQCQMDCISCFFSLTSVNPLVRQLVRALPTYLFGFMLLFLAAKRNAQPSATALLFANSSA